MRILPFSKVFRTLLAWAILCKEGCPNVYFSLNVNQISMTMDIYSHVLPSMQVDAVNRLNDLLKEGVSSKEVQL